ncbi:MAG: peptidase U32 family protein, partial [Moraxellaceae bacterium]
ITNIETVEFYSVFADVMVMARELSLLQVQTINKEIERREITGPSGKLVRTEVFGHGALCMAVSGKCYLSLHTNYSSANRGACIQNCRKSYIVMDKDEGVEFEVDNEFIMSAKDLCTIDFIDKIIDAGITVLKIEGRGRSADYVYTTTQCYREAIDTHYEGSVSPDKIANWKARLSTVFNRGFWDGYYLGRKMGEWSDNAGSKATKRKVYIGKGIKYYDGAGIGEFLIEAQGVEVGDELIVTGPTTGVIETVLHEMRCDDEPVQVVKRGVTITFPISEKVRPSDKLYKLIPVE